MACAFELTFPLCGKVSRHIEPLYDLALRTYRQPHIMSAPCRLAIGATRALESGAAPRVARRTFVSHSSTSTSSRATRGTNTQCLREAQLSSAGTSRSATSLRGQTRTFTQSASRNKLKTIDQIRARNRGGVCSSFFQPIRI